MAEKEENQTDDTAQDGTATAEETAAEETSAEEASADEAAAEQQDDESTEGARVVAQQAAFREDASEEQGEDERNMRKERVGVVVSNKMEKTIVVSIERSKKHPMYQKYLTRSANKMAHDENNDAGEGDTVRIIETRPISKHKRWRLVDILERAK